jgi:hypothetical protein
MTILLAVLRLSGRSAPNERLQADRFAAIAASARRLNRRPLAVRGGGSHMARFQIPYLGTVANFKTVFVWCFAGCVLLMGSRSLLAALQAGAVQTVFLGDVARLLADQNISELERLMPGGQKPWLVIGERVQVSTTHIIQAYLPAQSLSGEVRRGTMIKLRRDRNNPAWSIIDYSQQPYPESVNWAQVRVAGQSFDQMRGDEDQNRPFLLTGQFEDDELMSIVNFIRSGPMRPGTPLRISAGPIISLVREQSAVRVWIRMGDTAWQSLAIRPDGQSWTIVGVAEARA